MDSNSPSKELGPYLEYYTSFTKAFTYKAVADTDAIDKMLEEYVHLHKLRLPILRIDHSKYLFGTRFI